MIQVTEPFLPPIEEYIEYLEGIWDRNWLTNQGPLVREFENKLQEIHKIQTPVHCVANGAQGLQLALKALGVGGEVITTPFSYVATTSCPLWEGCELIFADIEPDTLTVSPAAVEAKITPRTEAILVTHVYGNPCDVEALDAIAEKHGLVIIYDAAHAFGVNYKGKSILEYGDVSMVSLHSTKLVHAVEGGFVTAQDASVSKKIEWMRRFAHNGPEDFHGVGTNAKMSEFHAAMGLCNLNHYQRILESRKNICDLYDEKLFVGKNPDELPYSNLTYRAGASRNYCYFPIIFRTEQKLLRTMKALSEIFVSARRYFYPDLAEVFTPENSNQCPVSSKISRRVLCLPLSTRMKDEQVIEIADKILDEN